MNWIKVRTHLISHPHVVRIASALCLPSVHVFGALVHLWSVADSHADGDLLRNMTPAALDRLTETPGLTAELATVGWIIVREDGMQLVNYQEHNGASAKRRALEAKRKKGFRIASAECPQDVRIESGQDAELEKNRYKKKKKKKEKENSDSSPVFITFPTDGEVPHWHLRQAKVNRLTELFPKLDVMAEAYKALAWVEANPDNRKTAAGMDRFFTGWLTRASDKPKPPAAPTYQTRTAPIVRPWSEVFAQQAGLTTAGSGQPLPCLPEVVR
jgi:hypothetical protein